MGEKTEKIRPGLCTAPERKQILSSNSPRRKVEDVRKSWEMNLCHQLGGRGIDKCFLIRIPAIKGRHTRAQSHTLKKARAQNLPLCLSLSLDNPRAAGWECCSHGDCMSHLNSGSGMGETNLPSLILLPPVNHMSPQMSSPHLNSDPWALPSQGLSCTYFWKNKDSPFSALTETWDRNEILYCPNNQELRPPNIGQWGLVGLSVKGREANRRVIPGHPQWGRKDYFNYYRPKNRATGKSAPFFSITTSTRVFIFVFLNKQTKNTNDPKLRSVNWWWHRCNLASKLLKFVASESAIGALISLIL